MGTDSGGVAEVISNGENGYLIPVGDYHALAYKLEELLADDARRKAFGEAAAKMAAETFLADKMTKKIERLYLEARR